MKRVAVFGNAGGGKSTLARRLAELTRVTGGTATTTDVGDALVAAVANA